MTDGYQSAVPSFRLQTGVIKPSLGLVNEWRDPGTEDNLDLHDIWRNETQDQRLYITAEYHETWCLEAGQCNTNQGLSAFVN